jgi:tungstate transport system permease protein
MNDITGGLKEALLLLITLDSQVTKIIYLSMYVSGLGLLISAVVGIPLGSWLGLTNFRGKRVVVALLYTGMGFPPVVIGLFVLLLLSKSGPLGFLGWLYTVKAMVLAQAIISFPLVAGFTMAAVMGVDRNLRRQLKALGASKIQTTYTILMEARIGVLVSIIAGFGSIISEVGAVMMVGGNIENFTRVLTTAIVLETRKGNFGLAIAFGIILLLLSFIVNFAMLHFQKKELLSYDE